MTDVTAIRACVFDAYGTLLNVHAPVARHAARLGSGAQMLSQTWRTKQLEYSWVRALSDRYRDFWALTEQALDYAMALHGVADPALRQDLLDAYRQLDAYPEVPDTLEALRAAGLTVAILSNGSPAMLSSAVRAADIESLLDATISVDELQIYKPHPRVYALAARRLGFTAEQIGFVSSNAWDVFGAHSFGFRTFWVNRTRQPAEYLAPERLDVIDDLAALPSRLGIA
ncbi:MAG: haloacid dehalogenase type II [Burkholderiales bacterium]|nr:haloacid dehalogenase type II [Burkholderiales bacterium]